MAQALNYDPITGSPVPEIWGGVKIALDAELTQLNDFNFDLIWISDYGANLDDLCSRRWAQVDFSDTGIHRDAALRNLIQRFPHERIKLATIAVRCGLKDVWAEQNDETKTIIMAKMLGSRRE